MSKYSWAKGATAAVAGAPGPRGLGPLAAAQARGPRASPWAQVMPMCPGAEALAHEYFDIGAHKYFEHTGVWHT